MQVISFFYVFFRPCLQTVEQISMEFFSVEKFVNAVKQFVPVDLATWPALANIIMDRKVVNAIFRFISFPGLGFFCGL